MAARPETPVGGGASGAPDVLLGATRLVETPLGPVLVTVNESGPGEPAEVFVRAGKVGSDLAAFAEAIGRLCSLCLQLESPTRGAERLRLIADELAGIGGAGSIGADGARSLPDAVARALASALPPAGTADASTAMFARYRVRRSATPRPARAAP